MSLSSKETILSSSGGVAKGGNAHLTVYPLLPSFMCVLSVMSTQNSPNSFTLCSLEENFLFMLNKMEK